MSDEQLRLQATVVDGFTSPLRNLNAQLRGIANAPAIAQVRKDWAGLGADVEKVTAGLRTGMVPALNMAGVASIGLVETVRRVAMAGVNFARNTQSVAMFSRGVGISMDRMKALNALGARFGVDAGAMQGAIGKLAETAFEMRRGTGDALTALRGMPGMGAFAEQLRGTKTFQEFSERAIEGLGKISNPIIRKHVSRLLFGTEDIGAIAAELGGTLQKELAEIEQRQGKVTKGLEDESKRTLEGWSRLWERLDQMSTNFFTHGLKLWNDTADAMNRPLFDSALPNAKAKRLEAEIERKRADVEWNERNAQGNPAFTARNRELAEEIKKLTEELRKAREQSGMVQPQSFMGSGFGGARVMNAALGFPGFPALRGGGRFNGLGGIGGDDGGAALLPRAPAIRLPQGVGGPRPGATGGAGTYNDSNEFFDAIMKAEGTARSARKPYTQGSPYNAVLGDGKYGLPPKPVSEMTLDEAYRFGRQIRARHGSSSALGAFQFVGTTMRDGMRALGLRGNDLFSPENQRRLASWRARVGNGLGAWEGFKLHPDQRARAAAALRAGRDRDVAAREPGAASRPGDALMGRRFGRDGDGAAKAPDIRNAVSIHLAPGLDNLRAKVVTTEGMFDTVNLNRGKRMQVADD